MGDRTAPRARAVVRTIVTWSMGAVLVVAAAVGVVAILVPAITGSTAFTVLTSSMQPTLPPGTFIVVRGTPVDELAPGDVITFQLRSGEPEVVTHRIVEVHRTTDGEPLFVTRGDANPTPDPAPVRAVQIRGELWYAIPWIGWLTRLVTGDLRAVIVPLVAAGLAVYAVWMFVGAARSRRRERTAM